MRSSTLTPRRSNVPSGKRITEADFTVSLRATKAPLIVTDEPEIPLDYWRPQPPKLDRQGLINALKARHVIPGAVLGRRSVSYAGRTIS